MGYVDYGNIFEMNIKAAEDVIETGKIIRYSLECIKNKSHSEQMLIKEIDAAYNKVQSIVSDLRKIYRSAYWHRFLIKCDMIQAACKDMWQLLIEITQNNMRVKDMLDFAMVDTVGIMMGMTPRVSVSEFKRICSNK